MDAALRKGMPGSKRFPSSIFRGISAALALTTLFVGCSHDPRISIREFVSRVDAEEAKHGPTASRPALPPAKPRFVPYRIGPGDVLVVSLIGLNTATDQMGVQARVNRMGEISLPLGGTVKVGDLETEDAERAIVEKFVPSIVRTLTVHIDVATYYTTDVLVLGEVNQPGLAQLHRNERDLIHAVATVGGMALTASGRVTLQRGVEPGGVSVTFDLRDPYDLARAVIVEPLQPGDVLTVEAADPFTIFVGGLVTAPGPKSFPSGTDINLLQVLAASGGVREDLYPVEGTLIRRIDGKDVQAKLDLDRLKDGRDPNIALAAGDILWVPDTPRTKLIDWLNKNIFFRAGMTFTYDPVQFERYRQTRNDGQLIRRAQKRSTVLHPFGGGAGTASSLSPLSLGDPLGFFQTGSTSAAAAGAVAAPTP